MAEHDPRRLTRQHAAAEPAATDSENEALEQLRTLERARFKSILEVSSILSSTLNLPRLLDIVLQATVRLTNTVAASILLIDRQTGNLYFEATSNIPRAQMARIEVPLEGSIAGWVVRHGKPRIIQQVKDDKEFTVSAQIDLLTTFSTDSLLAIPLTVKGQVIGVLEALNKQDGQPFTEDDVDLLMAMAGQAAVAIENARLFQQSDFVSEMVHELRTPLTAIVALAELIARPGLPPDRLTECAVTIQSEAQRLTKLASDYLDLARMESGRVHLQLEACDLGEIIQETITVQGPQAAERELTIQLDLAGELPTIIGDRNRIKQILLNLVSNAIKYNRPAGSIVLSASPEAGMVQVCVEDTGRGIPPEAIKNLFKRFYRVPDAEGYTTGTGLGLSIAQRIVLQHGGRIWAESELGQGSRFYFALPTRPPDQSEQLRLDENL